MCVHVYVSLVGLWVSGCGHEQDQRRRHRTDMEWNVEICRTQMGISSALIDRTQIFSLVASSRPSSWQERQAMDVRDVSVDEVSM